MLDDSLDRPPFQAHVELLRLFLTHRERIVDKIQGVLNAQRKPARYHQDRPLLSRDFEDCFFTLTAVTPDQSRLRGRLEAAQWASGFRPRQVPGLHNDLIHPAEMIMRGFYLWQMTRWPGRNGRLRYAHTLFNLYIVRNLELMSLRIWDAGPDNARERLADTQTLLDALWKSSPADQPVFVRDARWLIPLAQSPTTDELGAYFEVAERVAETLPREDGLEVQKAHVRMLGGHLTSQIRHYCMKEGVSIDANSVVLRTRTSNALDFALLIQGLVPLLEAYEHAQETGDDRKRLELAGAICQGISPDPDLFLNRLDLLGAYSMIEHVFIATDHAGEAAYTPTGQRHIRLLREYGARIGRMAEPLHDDCPNFRPLDGGYSPYGAIFGTPTNLIEDMALKSLHESTVPPFTLEDVFADGDAEKLAWVSGWRKLPHIDPAVQNLYDYPRQFAEDIFDRIEHALHRHVTDGEKIDDARTGRLFVISEDDTQADSKTAQIPDLPVRYVGSSDPEVVSAHEAESYDQTQLTRDRDEGHFALSFETPAGWIAIRKDFLTEVLGAGRDAKIAGLPPAAAGVLRLMCPDLIAPESVAHRSSGADPRASRPSGDAD